MVWLAKNESHSLSILLYSMYLFVPPLYILGLLDSEFALLEKDQIIHHLMRALTNQNYAIKILEFGKLNI
jgi:hypothetical protein